LGGVFEPVKEVFMRIESYTDYELVTLNTDVLVAWSVSYDPDWESYKIRRVNVSDYMDYTNYSQHKVDFILSQPEKYIDEINSDGPLGGIFYHIMFALECPSDILPLLMNSPIKVFGSIARYRLEVGK
jgi:hypothetical protein